MTDRKVTHVTVLKHFDDGSSEQMAKVNPATVASILAAGLAVMPTQQRAQGRYTYLNADRCPDHGAWKAVPAGVSKKTGKAYDAFYACDQDMGEERCTNKPSREWEQTHPPDRAGNDASQVDTAPGPADSSEFDDLPF